MTAKRIKTRHRKHWVVLSLVLTFITSAISYNLYYIHKQAILQEQLLMLGQARAISKHIEHHLASVATILSDMAEDYQVTWSKHDTEHTSYHIKILAAAVPGIRTLRIINENGIVNAASMPQLIGRDASNCQYFADTKKTGFSEQLYISPPYADFFGKYVFNASKVIIDKNGRFQGIVTAAITAELLQDILQTGIYADDMQNNIVHGDGIRFASVPDMPEQIGRTLAIPDTLFKHHLASKQVVNIFHDQAVGVKMNRLFAIMTISPKDLHMDKPLVLIISRKPEAVLKGWKREMLFQLTTLILIAAVSITVLARFHHRQAEYELKSARADELVLMRYQLLEYATMATSEELLQYSLDEICKLNNSPIGFYHFISQDQQTITMQAWSSSTKDGSCKLSGHNHYPLDKAGIWIECIKTRAPVIHNDYMAIKHKKGLPEGHVRLTRELVVPLIRDERIVAVMGVGNKQAAYSIKDAEEVLYLADVAWEILETRKAQEDLKRANELLENQARIDFLTGTYNRRMFDTLLTAETVKACRHKSELSLIMLDIDHFKQVNDTWGHSTGDRLLKGMAELIAHRLRSYDIFCRYGGEEFVILCPKTDSTQAEAVANVLRVLIMEHDFGGKLRATVSFGVSQYIHDEPLEEFISRSDDALYMAKRDGRNRVQTL